MARRNEELAKMVDAAKAVNYFQRVVDAPEAGVMKGGECVVCTTGEGGVGRMRMENGGVVEENKRYEFVGFKIVSRDEDGVDFIFDNAKEVEDCKSCVDRERLARIWGDEYEWGG